jgi:hypothetical protein
MKKAAQAGCLVFLSVFFAVCRVSEGAAPEKFKEEFKLSQLSPEELNFYLKIPGLLLPYVLCVAAAQNEPDLCQNLSDNEARLCRERLNTWHLFYRAVLLEGSATPELVQTCRRILKPLNNKGESGGKSLTVDECRRGIESIISRKPSVECAASPSCAAPISRDKAACGDDLFCVDQITYLNAIDDNSLTACENIQDESLRVLCKVGLTQNPEDCKECASFKKFIDQYYDDSIARQKEAEMTPEQKGGTP